MSRTKKNRPLQESLTTPIPQETAHFSTKSGIKKSVRIIPRSIHQEEYLDYLMDNDKIIVIASGPAGCGKTQLAMLAGIKALSEKKVNNLILCRPSVGVDDEDLGFLPGDINDKMAPWTRPLFDVLYEYYSAKDIQNMLENKVIEMAPLMHMRGRNLKNCFVVADEFQNTTVSQCKTLFTRICDGTKIVITGDNDQSDRKSNENGLLFFKNAIQNYGGSQYISSVEFDSKDIERHAVVKDVLEIFRASGK